MNKKKKVKEKYFFRQRILEGLCKEVLHVRRTREKDVGGKSCLSLRGCCYSPRLCHEGHFSGLLIILIISAKEIQGKSLQVKTNFLISAVLEVMHFLAEPH